jgi:hypothetical protein
VPRDGDLLPPDWDGAIPEAIWPEALISAVRQDVGALASARAIETLRVWQDRARSTVDSALKREALDRLKEIAAALLRPDAGPRSAPKPSADRDRVALRRAARELAGKLALSSDGPTGSESVESADGYEILGPIGERTPTPSGPAEVRAGSEDHTVFSFENKRSDDEPSGPIDLDDGGAFSSGDKEQVTPWRPSAAPAAPKPPERSDEETHDAAFLPALRARATLKPRSPRGFGDENPTTTIPLPDRVSELRKREMVADLVEDAVEPPPPASPPPVPQPTSVESPNRGSSSSARKVPPKPGVIRRSSVPPMPPKKEERPRASMIQVRALYLAILPLCRELVPLSAERRSRRFWAHWREVSGDRGVRHETVEALLKSSKDVRTLASELIAEVQTVDPDSVRSLLDRIETEVVANAESSRAPAASEERARGPLVGAAVRVEGFEREE